MRNFKTFSTARLAIDGLLIALFFVLSLFSVEIGGIKLTFDSLPVVIAAVLFSPLDAFLVGLFGAFLEQMLRFGFTATTLLWILPPACRGLTIALGLRVLPRADRWPVYYGVCVFAAAVTSILNTAVYYLDSVLYDYYTYMLIFGVFFLRILSGALAGILTATVALPVTAALKKTKLSIYFSERKLL